MRTVTVVIPSHNSGIYLEECVASVQDNSTGVDTQIIVVDDESTDESSLNVLLSLRHKPGVDVIRHEKNRGVQAARNTGLKAATGDYVICLDGDDVLLRIAGPDSFLSQATQMLEENPDLAFIHTMSKMQGEFSGMTIGSYPLTEHMATRKHHVPTSIVYRRKEIIEGLEYAESVRKWQDWAFGVSLLARRSMRGAGTAVGFVKGPGHGYRIHSTAPRISRAPLSERDAAKPVVEAYLEYFAAKYPGVAKDVHSLTNAVVNSKPSFLKDLLIMASFDLGQALELVQQRDYRLSSTIVDKYGIP